MVANPCAAVTAEGWPVSVWHVGTIDPKVVAQIAPNKLETWSAYAFEYVDIWLAMMTERFGVMAGHTQIFDLDGILGRECIYICGPPFVIGCIRYRNVTVFVTVFRNGVGRMTGAWRAHNGCQNAVRGAS